MPATIRLSAFCFVNLSTKQAEMESSNVLSDPVPSSSILTENETFPVIRSESELEGKVGRTGFTFAMAFHRALFFSIRSEQNIVGINTVRWKPENRPKSPSKPTLDTTAKYRN